jgi:hypothetical protein
VTSQAPPELHAAVPWVGVGQGEHAMELAQPVATVLSTHIPPQRCCGKKQVTPLLELAATEVLEVVVDELVVVAPELVVVAPELVVVEEPVVEPTVVVLDVEVSPPFPPRPPAPPAGSSEDPLAQDATIANPSIHTVRQVDR